MILRTQKLKYPLEILEFVFDDIKEASESGVL